MEKGNREGDKNKSIHIVDTFSTPWFFSAAIEQMANQTSKIPGSKKQVEYRERTVDGRFSLPSCAPIIPDVAQNEAISRPRAIARFWLNCSTRKKTPPRGRRGEVACSMESGETLRSRSETGMQRGDVYDQFHGKTVIDRFLDFQTDQQTTLASILLSCLLLLFIRDTYDALNERSCTNRSISPRYFPPFFPHPFLSHSTPSLDKFGRNLRRRPPRIPKRSRRNSLSRRKTSLPIRLECFSLGGGGKRQGKKVR